MRLLPLIQRETKGPVATQRGDEGMRARKRRGACPLTYPSFAGATSSPAEAGEDMGYYSRFKSGGVASSFSAAITASRVIGVWS